MKPKRGRAWKRKHNGDSTTAPDDIAELFRQQCRENGEPVPDDEEIADSLNQLLSEGIISKEITEDGVGLSLDWDNIIEKTDPTRN